MSPGRDAALIGCLLMAPALLTLHGARSEPTGARLTTLAFRVHRMEPMLAFYREAFGVEFEEVPTGGGIVSRFGEMGGVTLKFVPIRDRTDFEDFPVHQPGIEVPDLNVVVAAALKHGGKVLDTPRKDGGRTHASVRDPDGNTLELYGP